MDRRTNAPQRAAQHAEGPPETWSPRRPLMAMFESLGSAPFGGTPLYRTMSSFPSAVCAPLAARTK
jgi:hypothetical protein